MEWFRFYDEVVDDPKVQRLPAALFKEWVNILCLCNRNDPRGVLPAVEDVAFGLRCSMAKAKGTIKKLTEAGLLVTVDGVTTPNGWSKRQRVSDDVAKRVAESRARNVTRNAECNVTSNTPETLPHVRATDTDTETDTELTTPSGVVGAQAPETPSDPPKPKEPKAKRGTQLPPDWQVSDALRQWAHEHEFTDHDLDQEAPKFVAYWLSKGEARKDWNAGFQLWMRNAQQYGHLLAKPPQNTRPDDGYLNPNDLLQRAREARERDERLRAAGDPGGTDDNVPDSARSRGSISARAS